MQLKDLINDIDDMLEVYFKYSDEKPIIITDAEHFRNFNNKEKGLNLEEGLNTYKGYYVVLRNDLPNDTKIYVMAEKDYIRNTIKTLEEATYKLMYGSGDVPKGLLSEIGGDKE